MFDVSFRRTLSEIPAAAYQDRRVAEMLLAGWRRRGLVLALAILALAGTGVVLFLQHPSYRAEAIVQLNFNQREVGPPGDHANAVAVEGLSIVQGEARIIRSDLIAQRVVQRLHLEQDLQPSLLETVFDRLRSRVTDLLETHGWVLRAADKESAHARRLDAAERAFASKLSVETDNRSYLIVIGFTSGDARRSATVANAVADDYLALRAQAVTGEMDRIADRLRGDLDAKNKELDAADAAVVQFRVHSGFLELGAQGESLDQQRLRGLSDQLSAASLARVQQEDQLAQMRSMMVGGGVPGVAVAQMSPVLEAEQQRDLARHDVAELRARLGDHHPATRAAEAKLADARTALSSQVDQSVATATARLASARQTEAALKEQLAHLQQLIIQTRKGQEATLRDLDARVQTLRGQAGSLAASLQQALMIRDMQRVPASLIVPAQPSFALGTHAGLLLVLAALGGAAAGIALAVALESGDHGFRTSGEVGEETQLRCLGMVPELSAAAPPAAVFNEAIRTVGVAAGLFDKVDECLIVLVTSSVAGEGRSTVCRALARALVLAGRRVMLVDGTPTREAPTPVVHAETPGVTPVATSKPSPVASLEPMLGSGERYVLVERGPASDVATTDVFGSGRLVELVSEFRKQFDIILLEGPPTMLVGDSIALGRLADRVLFVARWGATKRRVTRAALRRLQESAVEVSGVVLTRVDLGQHAKLGFVDQCTYYERETAFYDGLYEEPSDALVRF